jgi:hypothetical protein
MCALFFMENTLTDQNNPERQTAVPPMGLAAAETGPIDARVHTRQDVAGGPVCKSAGAANPDSTPEAAGKWGVAVTSMHGPKDPHVPTVTRY